MPGRYGIAIAALLVVVWLWYGMSIHSGFGEQLWRFNGGDAEFIIRVGWRRDVTFAAVTTNGIECGTLTTGAFWRDIKHAARTAAANITLNDRTINIYVLPGTNAREIGGLLSTAIMMARGLSFDDAYLAARRGLGDEFALTEGYKQQLRGILF